MLHTLTPTESAELTADDTCRAMHILPLRARWRDFYAALSYRVSASQVSVVKEVEKRSGVCFMAPWLKQSPSFKAMKCENLSEPRASQCTEGLK